jgi:4'-phosphopantetheinyl transferase EntD
VTVVGLAGGRLALSVVAVSRLRRGAALEHPVQLCQREHRAGRRALRAGLAALRIPAGRLARRPDGGVQAPPRVLVTISHRDGVAVAAAWAPDGGPAAVRRRPPSRRRMTGLGIDIERAGLLPHRALRLVCAGSELAGLREEPSWVDPTRLFAAKEALYKATPLAAERRFHPRQISLRPLNAHTGVCVLDLGGRAVTAYVTTRQVGQRWLALCVAAG